MGRSSTDERSAKAVAAALAPYAWREFTKRMLARRVVGAVDQQHVIGFLSGLPGTDVGMVGAVDPADPSDERVEALVRWLDGQPWRGWSLARLCVDLLSSLEASQSAHDAFDSDLRRLIEGHDGGGPPG